MIFSKIGWSPHRYIILLSAASVCLLAFSAWADLPLVTEALPMVGTGRHGHTYLGRRVPFRFVQLSPDTHTKGCDACTGYHHSDTNILGFSHTHLSGTDDMDLGDLLIMAVTGPLETSGGHKPLDAERLRSDFSHETEVAQPGYHRVMLYRRMKVYRHRSRSQYSLTTCKNEAFSLRI